MKIEIKKLLIIIIPLVLFIIIDVLFIKKYLSSKDMQLREKEVVRIANANNLMTALINIADKKGFFLKEGLDIKITNFNIGKECMESLFRGENDFAVSALTPVVINGINKMDFKIISTISSSDNNYKIIARKDHNIIDPQDLKSKKIGVPLNTGFEYFLKIYLDRIGIKKEDVTFVDIDFNKGTDEISSGKIDAIVTTDSFVMKIIDSLKENSTIFQEPGLHSFYAVLSVSPSYIKEKPQNIQKILKALKIASDYFYLNKSDSCKILGEYYNTEYSEIEKITESCDFQLTLRQGLVTSLEKEFLRFCEENNKMEIEPPNYLQYIDEDYLRKLFPENVDIIR